MFEPSAARKKRSHDEAEKPFWISFSDLMTALMVLFLVAMAVALMGVTQGLDVARAEHCQRWLKRLVLDGYASQEGSYLYNLNLSLERSDRVLCVLRDAHAPNAPVRQTVMPSALCFLWAVRRSIRPF